MTKPLTLPINHIIVGDRTRRDLGDIAGLALSIDELGLLQPIAVTADNRLIEGSRRIRAFQLLGKTEIPVHVADIDAIVRGEFAANVCRKDFTPSELVAIGREVERVERERARKRMVSAHVSPGNLPELEKGDARDKTAAKLGTSGRTYERACAVVDAAELDPARFGQLVEDMDRTGRVNGVYKRLQVARQAEAIRTEPPPLPNRGPYRVAVCDPPWPFDIRQDDPSHRATHPYPQMSLDQIRALPVASVMHAESILWLWTTNFHMRHAYSLLDAWGFEAQTILTWVKDKIGLGHWLRGRTEHCIFATRGRPTVTHKNQTTALFAPARGHSVKPAEFYDLVESLCPAPRFCDLFSRYRHNSKWDCHGGEAPKGETWDEMWKRPFEPFEPSPPPTGELSIPPFLRRSAP